jgi:hypothetical protein
VVEALHTRAVELDVVRRPSGTELLATGGQLPDEVGQAAIVGVATGLGAEDADGVVGNGVPVEATP